MEGARGSTNMLNFDLLVFAGRFDAASSQDVLDDAISELPALLESDQTLEGHAEAVMVRETDRYGSINVAGTALLGVRITTEVHSR